MELSQPAPGADLLEHATWTCCALESDAATTPEELALAAAVWLPAAVPGTAASAYRDIGRHIDPTAIDGQDWWWRTNFVTSGANSSFRLRCEGIATIWELWIDEEPIAHGVNMFRGEELLVELQPGAHELHLRCRALNPILQIRRPRPRWRSAVVAHQNLRWLRTSMLGRTPSWTLTPPPVGPWRPITISPILSSAVVDRLIRAVCDDDGAGGRVSAELRLLGEVASSDLHLEIHSRVDDRLVARGAPLDVERTESIARTREGTRLENGSGENEGLRVVFDVHVETVERWWPHTHGAPALYDVQLVAGDHTIPLGSIGFRSIEVDDTDGAFRLLVNGVAIFVRGAAWFPLDPVGFVSSISEKRHCLEQAREANLNMIRIPGGSAYEDEPFLTACDELGLLVWQDAMLAFVDPPEDPDFLAELDVELTQLLTPLGQHPCLAVFCGGQEIEAHAAMFGLAAGDRASSILQYSIPALSARLIPTTPYLTSSPVGGEPPFRLDTGISHYYGVGTYLRDLADAQLAGVRFMSEGMAFATPPDDETLLGVFGKAQVVGHDPRWKQAIHHEAGRAFDLEDVREFYVRELFGADPLLSRYLDPEHHLDLGRAVVAEIFTTVLSQWRTSESSCDGALLIALRDLTPGAGWGVIDALGRAKAPWYALRRIFAPIGVAVIDHGLDGLTLHVFNDHPRDLIAEVEIALYAGSPTPLERSSLVATLSPHSQQRFDFSQLFEGFRDLSYAFRFGQLSVEAIEVTMKTEVSPSVRLVHLPGGPRLEQQRDVGLRARAKAYDGAWELCIGTRDLAHYVVIDTPGFVAEDSWFHLAPGSETRVRLRASGKRTVPNGYVRALNSKVQTSIEIVN